MSDSTLDEKVKDSNGYSNRLDKYKPRLSADNDILNIYLNEINKIPLLTREEEEDISEKMFKGDEKAKEKLITSNLRFVVSIAKKYHVSGMPLIELINEGNTGLVIAAEEFNYKRGYHFISYAVWWIRQSILKSIASSRFIRLPLNRSSDVRKIEESINRLTEKLKRCPSAAEIAECIDMSNEDVHILLNATQKTVSLESSINYDDASILYDVISDAKALKPDYNAVLLSLRKNLSYVLNSLSEHEKVIIILRYGLNDCKKMSLENIGKKFHLSKERIRQIEKKAIKRLKYPMRSSKLKPFYESYSRIN